MGMNGLVPSRKEAGMGYVIMTDSRKCDEALFMVDRRRQRRSFWSNRLDDAFVYANRRAADMSWDAHKDTW
jgi:hypothetical protein